jgi:hypothetical protein
MRLVKKVEAEPTACELLAVEICELQIDVDELRYRLDGRRPEPEVETAERRARYERTLRIVERALGEKRQ